jgi:hypothetical protein
MRKCFWFVWSLAVISAAPALSQSLPDSLNNESVSAFRNIYFQEIKGNALIYEGSKYDAETKSADGFPYFQADMIRQGTITYQGVKYTLQKFYYDLTKDAVVIFNYDHDVLILPDQEKIDSFSIGRHLFVRIGKLPGLPVNGFYEELYAGDPGLYARREKKFYYGAGFQDNRYVEKNEYFIRIKDVFYKCGKKSDMLTIFSDQADALKKYIRIKKIRFKDDFESALLECTIYYAGLKH